ncbi:unnamed protein product [Coffea canephora]|uniref:Uncharacterized protein n=1 Tax=Coffea canephora TaxID=49390 RepID=A0A068TUW6_COFCA|nr:unnamed protein product [Coffea canephora]
MVLVKKYCPTEPQVEKVEPNMHDIDEEDEEETLSFCEFSISGDADTWEDSSRESQNTSFKSSEGDDYFEFFSGELSSGKASFSYTPPENIIFCGKLISFKQPISENAERIEKVKHKKHKRRGFFRWKWNLASSLKRRISRRKNASNSTGAKKGSSGGYKSLPAPEASDQGHKNIRRKRNKEQDLSAHKMSFLTSSGKSKWYMFFFGVTKFRTKMELRDMKNRQARRPSSSFSKTRSENDDSSNNHSPCMARSNGLWAVLRAMSCSGDPRATAVVKASIGGIADV